MLMQYTLVFFFFFQAEDGIRDVAVTGVQTCALPISVSKKFKGLRCAYCAVREAVTGDHIFAREFFLPSARANLPKAPICAECNNEKSKLEHYLTTVLPFGGRHPDASENLASMVPKRLGRNVRLHRHLKEKQKVVFVPDKDGKLEDTIAIPFEGDRKSVV